MFCHIQTGEVQGISYLALGHPFRDVPAISALRDIMKTVCLGKYPKASKRMEKMVFASPLLWILETHCCLITE